jgi:hypothetical protein
MQEVADSKKAHIQAKLTEAASRREIVIEHIKTTAAMSATPRGASASKSP